MEQGQRDGQTLSKRFVGDKKMKKVEQSGAWEGRGGMAVPISHEPNDL